MTTPPPSPPPAAPAHAAGSSGARRRPGRSSSPPHGRCWLTTPPRRPASRRSPNTADVGFGSFYNHFSSKAELFEAAVADVLDELGALLDQLSVDVDDPALGLRPLGPADPAACAAAAPRWPRC